MVSHQIPIVGPKTIDGVEVEIEFLTDQTGSQQEKVLVVQKGLSFPLRRDNQKASKDLYYIFDILAGIPDSYHLTRGDFEDLSMNHPAWFKKFKANLSTQFESPDAEGPLRVVKQRPADAFSGLDDDQLRYFAHGTVEQLIKKLEPLE